MLRASVSPHDRFPLLVGLLVPPPPFGSLFRHRHLLLDDLEHVVMAGLPPLLHFLLRYVLLRFHQLVPRLDGPWKLEEFLCFS